MTERRQSSIRWTPNMIPYHGYENYHHQSIHENNKPPRLIFKVPRVVPNQKERFEKEEIFKKHSRDQEVRYTLYRDRPLHERQAKFQAGCRDGHVELSYSSSGLVLILSWNPLPNGFHGGPLAKNGCDFTKEPGKVHIRSSVILNGVSVRWNGWVDLERLDGIGCVEFDEELARAEDAVLTQQIEMYNQRIKEFEDRHRLHNDQLHHLKRIQY